MRVLSKGQVMRRSWSSSVRDGRGDGDGGGSGEVVFRWEAGRGVRVNGLHRVL